MARDQGSRRSGGRSSTTARSGRRQILRRIKERNPGPLDGEEVARLFREIMSACLALEQPVKAAFLGPEGTFTQAAALKQFGHSVRTVAMATIGEIFREVEAGSCDYGVVPVENSTEGVISHTLDMFLDLAAADHRRGEPAHPSPPDEPGRRTWPPSGPSIPTSSPWPSAGAGWTATCPRPSASRSAATPRRRAWRAGEPGRAAVAGLPAAEIYGLPVLAQRIEDEPGNTTRFLVIGDQDAAAQRAGQDQPAALLPQRVRRSARPAVAARGARDQHDPHRVAPLPAGDLGLCLLHRHHAATARTPRSPRPWST